MKNCRKFGLTIAFIYLLLSLLFILYYKINNIEQDTFMWMYLGMVNYPLSEIYLEILELIQNNYYFLQLFSYLFFLIIAVIWWWGIAFLICYTTNKIFKIYFLQIVVNLLTILVWLYYIFHL